MKCALVISAHPDDETLGLGGTLALLAASGWAVKPIIVAGHAIVRHGSSTEADERMRNCCRRACVKLGIEPPAFLNLPNQRLDTLSQVDINRMLEDLIERLQPHTVFTHFHGDINRDHQILYESTMVATRPKPDCCVRRVLVYTAPSSTDWIPFTTGRVFTPNWYVDIESVIERKLDALECYPSELPEPPHPRSLTMLKRYAELCGSRVGYRFAEEFMLIRNLDGFCDGGPDD